MNKILPYSTGHFVLHDHMMTSSVWHIFYSTENISRFRKPPCFTKITKINRRKVETILSGTLPPRILHTSNRTIVPTIDSNYSLIRTSIVATIVLLEINGRSEHRYSSRLPGSLL